MLTPTYLIINLSKESPQEDHMVILNHWLKKQCSLNHYYKTPHYPLQVGTLSLEDISLVAPLPGKEVKLFFFTLSKMLPLRFNSASLCQVNK